MKVTPFILFIILLVVLVIAIVFRNILPLSYAEGFGSFSNNINTLSSVMIPPYSNSASTVVKLYDNIFFDTLNANLIEVDSQPVGNTITSNTTIDAVYVTVRDGTTSSQKYVDINSATESKIGSITKSTKSWTYTTKSKNTSTYQVIYVAWETETFIHIIQLTSPIKNIASFYFTPTTDNSFIYPSDKNIVLTTAINVTDRTPEYTIDSLYSGNAQVYSLSSTFAYDPYSGNVIYHPNNATGTIVNNRSGGVVTNPIVSTSNTITNVGFMPWILPDDAGRMLLYVPNNVNTLLVMLSLDSATSSKFVIGQVAGFRGTVLSYDPNSSEVKKTTETTCDKEETDDGTIVPPDSGPNSDYYKWLAYWNTISNSSSKMDYTDYLLKTQVVPPVCPQCPNCPDCGKDGTCTNCGGQGGSGTKTTDGNSVVSQPASNLTVSTPGAFATTADPNTIGGAVTTTGVGVVSGAGGMVQTAGGVVNNAVNVTGGLLYGAGSGATNLLKSAGRGVKDIFSQPYQQSGQGWSYNGGGQGWVNEPTGNMGNNSPSQEQQAPGSQSSSANYNNYSYYGSLPSKSGNYLPLTADFSAFSK
jgi:hypothetical protein